MTVFPVAAADRHRFFLTFMIFSPVVMEEDDDSDFNVIKPTLLQQLKTILDQYPDDGQILKVRLVLVNTGTRGTCHRKNKDVNASKEVCLLFGIRTKGEAAADLFSCKDSHGPFLLALVLFCCFLVGSDNEARFAKLQSICFHVVLSDYFRRICFGCAWVLCRITSTLCLLF